MSTCNTLNTIKPAFIAGTAILTMISQPFIGKQHLLSLLKTEERAFESPAFSYTPIENRIILTSMAENFEPIVEIQTTKRLKVRITRPTQLKLQSVQDSEGMY